MTTEISEIMPPWAWTEYTHIESYPPMPLATITPAQFLKRLVDEYDSAIQDFPANGNDTFSAFVEEIGEVGKAVNEFKRAKTSDEAAQWRDNMILECVQAAAMAMRIACEPVKR